MQRLLAGALRARPQGVNDDKLSEGSHCITMGTILLDYFVGFLVGYWYFLNWTCMKHAFHHTMWNSNWTHFVEKKTEIWANSFIPKNWNDSVRLIFHFFLGHTFPIWSFWAHFKSAAKKLRKASLSPKMAISGSLLDHFGHWPRFSHHTLSKLFSFN